jgi:hypothetical protein
MTNDMVKNFVCNLRKGGEIRGGLENPLIKINVERIHDLILLRIPTNI